MLFLDALKQLKLGDAMRRASWADSEGYLKILPGMQYVWKIVLTPSPNAGNFIFSIADFESDDWIKYEEPKPVVELVQEEDYVKNSSLDKMI